MTTTESVCFYPYILLLHLPWYLSNSFPPSNTVHPFYKRSLSHRQHLLHSCRSFVSSSPPISIVVSYIFPVFIMIPFNLFSFYGITAFFLYIMFFVQRVFLYNFPPLLSLSITCIIFLLYASPPLLTALVMTWLPPVVPPLPATILPPATLQSGARLTDWHGS